MFSMGKIAKRIGDERIGDSCNVASGSALVYLYRRFGFTQFGSDPDKAVCRYLIETSMRGFYLVFDIGGVNTFIRCTADYALFDRYGQEAQAAYPETTEFMCECHDVAEACLRDLLRPVFVRDVPITLLGRATAAELGEYNEEVERPPNEAQRSLMAGYGVQIEAYQEPNRYFAFMGLVEGAGGGNLVEGMKAVTELINKGIDNE